MRVVPNGYKEVSKAINHGVPLATIARSSLVLRAIVELMQSFLPKPDQAQAGLLGRLLKQN